MEGIFFRATWYLAPPATHAAAASRNERRKKCMHTLLQLYFSDPADDGTWTQTWMDNHTSVRDGRGQGRMDRQKDRQTDSLRASVRPAECLQVTSTCLC
jgi:hypothetical protein